MLEMFLSARGVLYLQWLLVLVVMTSPASLSLGVLLWTKRKGLCNY